MTLQQLVHILFVRQRMVLIVVFVAALGAATAVTFTREDEYDASATLFVGENRPATTGVSAVQLDEVLAQTYAELLDTSAVARDVAHNLPVPGTTEDLAGVFDFEVLTGTNLIEITATDQDPQRAAFLANTYARTFLARVARSAREDSETTLSRLSERIGVLAPEIERLESTGESPGALARNKNELLALQETYGTTQESIALQSSTLAIATEALPPNQPARPRTKLYLAIGAVLAAIAAAGAALLRNAFDKRVRGEDELVELLGVPVLGRIPVRPQSGSHQRYDESLQFLSANLQLHEESRDLRVLAVSSPIPADGKTTVVAGLGNAFSRTGAKVVVADCDLRKPRLAEVLGVPSYRGVTNVLVGSGDPLLLLQRSSSHGLDVLPAGPLPPNPAVLLGTPPFDEMLRRLRESTDYVLLDTPPVTVGAETSDAAFRADGVMLVVDLRRADRNALIATRDQLARSGARLLGIVINRVTESHGDYGYYGYRADDLEPATGRAASAALPASPSTR